MMSDDEFDEIMDAGLSMVGKLLVFLCGLLIIYIMRINDVLVPTLKIILSIIGLAVGFFVLVFVLGYIRVKLVDEIKSWLD